MKKHLLVILVLAVSAKTFCQTGNPSMTSTDYLKKSKKQNTTGWIFLGSGFGLTAIGLVVGVAGTVEEVAGAFTGEESNTFETGAVIAYVGVAGMLGSIPFFIASSKNKRNAKNISVSFKMETRPIVQQFSFVRSKYPAISLKLAL